MNCIVCDVPIVDANDSEEHVVANAIGGRLKVRGVVCRLCNGTTGHTWDAVLANQLHPLSIMFDIKRERGEVPHLKATTIAGEQIYIRNDGSLHPAPTAPVTYTEGDNTLMRVTTPTIEEAKKVLETLQKRRFHKLDVEKELSKAEEQWKFDSIFKFELGLGGVESGRAIVKAALTLALHNGVDARSCGNALRYLRNPDAPVPYGFFFERDLVANRPDRTPLHCVAVSSRGNDGQLLGYVEYFGVHRMVVCLADDYRGPEMHRAYAINPHRGEELHIDFSINISRQDMWRCYDYECLPEGTQVAAFHKVMPLAMQINQQRSIRDIAGKAARYAFANCGAKPGEILTAEQTRKLSAVAAQFLAPFLMHRLGRSAVNTEPAKS